MITVSTLTTSLAEANSAELRRQAARQRAIAGMERELDKLEQGGPRRRTRLRLMLAAAAAIAVALLASSSAWADSTHYYAAPGGSAAGSCASSAAPCDAQYALDSVPTGGDVELAPGTYNVNSPLTVSKPLTLHGSSGGPQAVIVNDHSNCDTCPSVALAINSPNVTVRDLKAVQASGNGAAIYAASLDASHPDTLERVTAEGDDGSAIWTLGRTVIRDSVAWSPNLGGIAVYAQATGEDTSVDLHNVTAVAGVGGVALDVVDGCAGGCTLAVSAENSIFQSGGDDVSSNGHGAGYHPVVSLTHSNYRLHSPDDWIGYPTTQGNQSDPPLFVNPTSGDFREKPGSPTVNAGAASPLIGDTDLAGAARRSGSAPDIGAFELQETAPPAPVATGTNPQGGPSPQGGSGATSHPRFAGVHIAGGSLKARHGKVRIAVSCPKNADRYCAGTLVLTRSGGAAARKVIGRAHFRLAPGRGGHVTVKLPRSLRKLRRIDAKATVVARDARGATQSASARVSIRRG
jgi:hypothetical protein